MASSGARPQTILLIGAGRMGMALLRGWLAAGRFAVQIVEPQPSPELAGLAANGAITLTARLSEIGEASPSAIVLAVKPQILKNQGDWLAVVGKSGGLVLSIAAGIGTALLKRELGDNTRVIRAMPNTPGAVGKGITALYAAPDLPEGDRALGQNLMAALGETLWLADESLMDAVTAVSGSGPAYVFLLVEALAEAARAQGLDDATAALLARATIMGAGALLGADARPAGDLRKDVTSPGGTTEAALNVLMAEDGLARLMARAVEAATRRGKELGS